MRLGWLGPEGLTTYLSCNLHSKDMKEPPQLTSQPTAVRMKVHHRASLVTSFPTLRPCGGPMGYDGWWTGLLEEVGALGCVCGLS